MFRKQNEETQSKLGNFSEQGRDVTLRIMSYLDVNSLAKISRVNKTFLFFPGQNLLWAQLICKQFQVGVPTEFKDHAIVYAKQLNAERKKIIDSLNSAFPNNRKLLEKIFDQIFQLPENFISDVKINAFVHLHEQPCGKSPDEEKVIAEFNRLFGYETERHDTSRKDIIKIFISILLSIPALGCTHLLDILLKKHEHLGKTIFGMFDGIINRGISFLHAAITTGEYVIAKKLITISNLNLGESYAVPDTGNDKRISCPTPLCLAIGIISQEKQIAKLNELKQLIVDLLIAGANPNLQSFHASPIQFCKSLILLERKNQHHLQETLKLLQTPVAKLKAGPSNPDKRSEKKRGCRMM